MPTCHTDPLPVGAERLSPEQRGRFVALCWTAQIYQQIPEPKASYVAGRDALAHWQQATDIEIFDRIAGYVK